MIITGWTCSAWMLWVTISHPGSSSRSFGNSFPRYPRTPGFRSRRRYFVIHTRWYSVRYAPCPLRRVSMPVSYRIAASAFTHGLCPWYSALRAGYRNILLWSNSLGVGLQRFNDCLQNSLVQLEDIRPRLGRDGKRRTLPQHGHVRMRHHCDAIACWRYFVF